MKQLDTFLWAEKGMDAQPKCLRNFNGLDLDFCLHADSSRPPTVALIGDSHSNALFWGLSKHLAEQGQNLINLGRGACIPFYDLESRYASGRDRCVNAMNGALTYALETESVKTIILASRGTTYITNKSFGNMENSWGGAYSP